MSDQSLLGFAVLAASLGPGYVFERVAETKRPPTPRSALVETVELVVTGSLFTISAALFVLSLVGAGVLGWVDLHEVALIGLNYVVLHPFKGLSTLGLIYLLSFSMSWGAATFLYRDTTHVIKPNKNPWHEVLLDRRPDEKSVFVTLVMRDWREISGMLASYTLESSDNRDLALVEPIAMKNPDETYPQDVSLDLLLVREPDVLFVRGNYISADDNRLV